MKREVAGWAFIVSLLVAAQFVSAPALAFTMAGLALGVGLLAFDPKKRAAATATA